ncbi:MAG TPA: ABC transporter permease [Chitinophagaceae bacterium]|nr:ABC transporter permease [Chitinophagaceae bacterium]
MIKNYFKVAVRNLWKNKGYSLLNILGLAIGLATCMLILIYVRNDLSFDRYNKNFGRIYRVDSDINFGGTHMVLAVAPDPLGPTLKRDYPEVEQYVRFHDLGGIMVKRGDENISETKVIYVDSTLFDVFSLPMVEGNPSTALVSPHTVVITESIALKYFNTVHALGKTMIFNGSEPYRVTGVIRDIPDQSHFHFDFFLPMSQDNQSRGNIWLSNNFNTYILLRTGTDPASLASHFNEMINRYVGPQVQQAIHTSLADLKTKGNYIRYSLMPLGRIHLYSNKVGEFEPNGSIEFVYIFSVIALFILLIACVNFMNLSTARSSLRAREVGIRKVLGSMRKALIIQFLTESILVTAASLVLAIGLAFLLMPYFNQLSQRHLRLGLFTDPWVIPGLILLMVLVGGVAGSYPAFYLSGFRPIQVLKGKLAAGFRRSNLRNTLVVFQFFISIVLIIGTIVIDSQMNFIRHKKLGFDRDHVLIINNCYPLNDNARVFKTEVLHMSGVKDATMTGYLPTSGNRNDNSFFKSPSLEQTGAIQMQTWSIDEDYIPTLGMGIDAGRNFSRQFPSDSTGVILNQAAVKLLGWTDPVNKRLYTLKEMGSQDQIVYHVVGVVRDFNFNSLRQEITPMGLFLGKDNGSLAIRINTDDISGLIGRVEQKWKELAPSQPFSYEFMDDDFNKIYQADERTGKIFISFAIFAILIACLGLFGLTVYAGQLRIKEISIRKTLGASILSILSLLSLDFLKLILIAFLVASPVAWWAMNKWLQGFAYHIGLSWGIFLSAGILAVLIALLTVSVQVIRVAGSNPVNALRSE